MEDEELKAIRNEYAKEWRKNNPEKVKAANAKFYAKMKFKREQEELKKKMEIDKEIKDRIVALANIITSSLQENSSVLMNIQIEEEYSQYDVLFSYNFTNFGRHQRGILTNDLIIGVIGFKTYGFNTHIHDTDPSYYSEKLGIHSNFLSFLFNEVRKQLKEMKKS